MYKARTALHLSIHHVYLGCAIFDLAIYFSEVNNGYTTHRRSITFQLYSKYMEIRHRPRVNGMRNTISWGMRTKEVEEEKTGLYEKSLRNGCVVTTDSECQKHPDMQW